MIKDALKYIVSLGEANVRDIVLPNGAVQTYSDKPLELIEEKIYRASDIEMDNLSSLVAYIKSGVDSMAEKMIIQVVDPETVRLFSPLDYQRRREVIAEVRARIPNFKYECFIEHESFCINVQAKFLDDPESDKALLLKFAGTVESGTVSEYGDDGVTQKATVKTGIASKGDALVPNPVKLRPFRTFTEVQQPMSQFIFRIKQDKYDGILCAIFEADGGAWKNAAMKSIKEYLEYELADCNKFIVIS